MINFTIFLVLITIVSFLLIVVVMVQNPKGGGLSSAIGGGSQQMGGVQKTTDFLDKSTWTLATILVALILLSSLSFSTGYSGEAPLMDESDVPAAPAATKPVGSTATPAPVTPAPAPAQ
jgi:preprotein translocase subunit SecG